ncbi:DUF4307 domain-containing protein [Gordonia sp. MP11Mi]|uniref:DUF4307 domain-containing protein n=1 Tax=Gordonia sp. MP11Mi TaxID=3022769 RepID=A0AA97CS20_9ACTN
MSSSDGGGIGPEPRSGPRATYPTERTASSRRRWFYVASVSVVVIGLAIAFFGYKQFADPDVSGDATAFEIVSSDTVSVQYTVNRNDPADAVSCVVRARADDGSEVGRREVLVPASDQIQVGANTEVVTSAPAVIGEVFGCTTDVPQYLKPAA